ncbi:MAG TPA: AAA family ATPase [Streptosporangiaceae bacterium]|nr:AAA family ATPase [Streptosporangiaceae bacterium]
MDKASRTCRYRPRVFIAPPWPEIYGTDTERKQDFAEAEATFDAVRGAYAGYGYEVISLPLATVGERARLRPRPAIAGGR